MNKRIIICNRICGLLALLILADIFVPFWCSAGDTASLMGVTGRQYNHYGLIEALNVATGGFSYTDITWYVLILTILCPVAAILCFYYCYSHKTAILPLLCGLTGLLLCLQVPAFRLGRGWALHLTLYIALILCSVYSIYCSIKYKTTKKR